MAEKDPLEKLEEQLNCAICLDTFTDPKVLQCHHVYCTECLEGLRVRSMRSLTCPKCRKETPIPENGVKGLEPAFHINNLLEIQDALQKKNAETGATCSEHVDEQLKLFCETCDKLICLKCVIKGANHHKCNYEVLDKLGTFEGEILAFLEPVKQNVTKMESVLEKLEDSRGEISDQRSVIKAGVQNTIKRLCEALEVRQTELIDQLEEVTDKKLARLTAQSDQIKTVRTKLQLCRVNVQEKLKTSSKQELAGAKTSIIKQIEESNSLVQLDSLKLNARADITFSASPDALAVCRNCGVLNVPEILVDPTQCHVRDPVVTAATLDEPTVLTVQTVNYLGDACEVPIKAFQCELLSEITDKITPVSDISSSGKQQVVRYTPTMKGRQQLSIKIQGKHIKDSPFSVQVKSDKIGHQIHEFGGVSKPWGIIINHKNELIVTEHDKHCVSVFTPRGKKLRSFGSKGSREGQFNNPRGVAVDNEDNILVADYKNNRIQKFRADGSFLAAVGNKGNGRLQFKGPKGIAFNTFNKKVYVVDENYRIQFRTCFWRNWSGSWEVV